LFLPQDMRENPPPTELPWDLRRRLAEKSHCTLCLVALVQRLPQA